MGPNPFTVGRISRRHPGWLVPHTVAGLNGTIPLGLKIRINLRLHRNSVTNFRLFLCNKWKAFV